LNAEPTALLHASGVAKSFEGVPALRNGCLTLHAGSVHALCGGNGAGKSTFLNIIMGILRRDAGQILLRGQAVDFASPRQALAQRIAIITQELSPIPGMTVAENIFLGREPKHAGIIIDYRTLFERAQALFAQLGFAIDPRMRMGRLSLAQTQLVEIAKAFSRQSDILIMDEPTSAIGEAETQVLFAAIRRVTAQGVGVLYVSHRLAEIFSIADEYTVLRDGGFVQSGKIADIDRRQLVQLIVGRQIQPTEPPSATTSRQQALLHVQNLTRQGEFHDICLSVAPGEILGIYGLMGSGRSEFLNCVYGLTRPDAGEVRLRDQVLPPGNPGAALKAGVSLVTEDRKDSGLVLSASVGFNASLAALPRLQRLGIIKGKAERRLVDALMQRLRVKATSPSMLVSGLSGGNQQKVVLARCMATDPICLLCDEPTRGIDEGAKREVYAFLQSFAAQGHAVIVVSSEASEVLDVSARIAIFRKGRLAEIIDGHSATQEDLLHLAS